MSVRARLQAALGGFAALLASCGAGSSGVVAAPGGGPPTFSSGGDTSILEQTNDALYRVAYRGVRRVELFGFEPVEYTEDVGSDGNGLFSIRVLEVVSPQTDVDLFKRLHNNREVLTYRMRDFRVRDYGLFQQHYDAAVNGTTDVAGVSCVQIEVRKSVHAQTRFLVDVDETNGVVMRWEERSLPNDTLMARVAFETFTPDGSVADMSLLNRKLPTETFTFADDLEAIFGFEVRKPDYLPTSTFRLEDRVERVEDPEIVGEHWAKMYVTDGLEMAVFMHRAPRLTAQNPAGTLGYVQYLEVGSWRVLTGELRGYPVIFGGRVSEEDLFNTVQSAF